MKNIVILCIEDEPEVREAVLRDLRPFEKHFRIEAAGDVTDAAAILGEVANDGDVPGVLVCDHRLPGESGVDFLSKIAGLPQYRGVRKILLTGQAGQQDTIRAINEAGLDHYLAKPWDPQDLVNSVRHELTAFVVSQDIDPMPYLAILEPEPLLEKIRQRGGAP
jgi:two-component system, OmpR family, phosphate regulon response regulator PhoB